MGFNGEKDTILEPHWVNASMIERNMNENQMANFGKAEYHLIHGNNDDNVHFLSAAQMEKALDSQGIDFDNFVSFTTFEPFLRHQFVCFLIDLFITHILSSMPMKIIVSDQQKLLISTFTETSLLESSNLGATNGMETVTLLLKHA